MAAAASASSTNRLRPFAATITLLLIVAALYLARVMLVPVVLAALLAFVLTPLVSALQRWRVPRVAAAILVSLLAFGFIGAIVATVFFQFKGLAAYLPTQKDNIHERAEGLHQMFSGEEFSDLMKVVDDAVRTVSPPKTPSNVDYGTIPPTPASAPAPPTTVPSNFWGPLLEWAAVPTVEIGIDVGVVVVLVTFMLCQHEDLRNRVIRLTGKRNVTSTTKALGEASRRVRKFLLHQFFINCTFGVVVALGLTFIGVPYGPLWGVLGAVLRYVPYVGTWLAAVCPLLMAMAGTKGWASPLMTLGLFVLLDLLITNIAEPIIYGRSIGVSGTALLIAAVFWTWLWGPLGLILSTPLTACLVVLGRTVPSMEFLSVLLGDDPPLSLPLSFYQRLLARDEDEASTLIEQYIQKNGVEDIYDQVLLPALVHAKENRDRGAMTPEDEEFILDATRRLLDTVVYPAQEAVNAKEVAEGGAAVECQLVLLGCPATDALDETALQMLQRLLPAGKCQFEVLSTDVLAGEVLTRVRETRPAMLIIAAVPPYSFAAVRYLCKKLRGQFADLKILVGCWGLREDVKATVDRLKSAGADLASAELLETRGLLLPLVQEAILARSAEKKKPSELVHS